MATAVNWLGSYSISQAKVDWLSSWCGFSSSGIPVLWSLAVTIIYDILGMSHLLWKSLTGKTDNSCYLFGELLMLTLSCKRPIFPKRTTVGVENLSIYGQ